MREAIALGHVDIGTEQHPARPGLGEDYGAAIRVLNGLGVEPRTGSVSK